MRRASASPLFNIETVASPADVEKHYEYMKTLGQGGQGKVFRAKRKSDGKEVAVKSIVPKDARQSRSVAREINVMYEMAQISRDIFVRLFRVFKHAPTFYLEMDLAEGDLDQYMNDEKLTVDDKYTIALDVADGLVELHKNKYIHGDLKPNNVLYYVDPTRTRGSRGRGYRFKLGDFGMACGSPCPDIGGTDGYVDPAVACFNGRKLNTTSDMYSFGVLLYNLFVGSVYALGNFCSRDILHLYETKRGMRQDSLWTLIFNLLQPFTPEDRLTAVQAREMLRTRKGIALWTDQAEALAKLQAAATGAPSTAAVAACARSRGQSRNSSASFLDHVKEAKEEHYELCSSTYTPQELREDLIKVGLRSAYVDKHMRAMSRQISSILKAGSMA